MPSNVVDEEGDRNLLDPMSKSGDANSDLSYITLSVDASPPTYEEALEILRKAQETHQWMESDIPTSSNSQQMIRSAGGSPVPSEQIENVRRAYSFDEATATVSRF